MNAEIFILFLSCVVNLLLAGFIYFKNPKSRTNISFAASVLMLVLWTVSVIFARLTNEHIIWIKNAYFFTTSALLLFLVFLKYFPSPRLPFNKIIFYFLLISGCIFLLLIYPTRFLIKISSPIKHIQNLKPSEVFGPGIDFFLYYLIIFIFFCIFTFVNKYKRGNKVEKTQIKFTAMGILLFLCFAILTNLFIPRFFQIDFGNIGPAFSFIMVGFIGYAIGRYKLFELKIILSEIFIVLIAVILFVQILIAETLFWKIIGTIVLIIFSLLGYSLIKSIHREIEFREKLEKAYQKLQELDKAKTEFLSIASHQLRTPLSILKGYLSMILEGVYGKLPIKLQPIVQKLFITNEQLIKLVNDLLNISRIEAGKIVIQKRKINIDQFFKLILDEIKPEIEKKNLKLQYRNLSSLHTVSLDPDKIRQVIFNILDNAIKYTQIGTITVEISQKDSKVLIKIQDTGIGMTKEETKRVFESFRRGKASQQMWTGGSGLGLYVAKKFVEMHNGKIWAESEGPGKGSTFYIELPIVNK